MLGLIIAVRTIMVRRDSEPIKTISVQIEDSPDSLVVSLLTFFASFSLVLLVAGFVTLYWWRPPFLEPLRQGIIATYENWQQSNNGTTSNAETAVYQAIESPRIEPQFISTSPLQAQEEVPAPQLMESDRASQLKTEDVLDDPFRRVDQTFHVPESLKKRTQFWFNIYTKYDSNNHVIHHDRFPWIVYRVVDTTDTMYNSPGPEWLRRDRGLKRAQKEKNEIIQALKKLSHRSGYKNLSATELEVFKALSHLPGARQKVFRLAAESVRVQLGQKDFFIGGLRNSSRYLPYMEEEFQRQGIPPDLTRLPLVESSFNEKAESRVGASGIWQIMPRTGRAYMRVDDNIDERNSPLKATKVAAILLKKNNRALDSWPLTVTSYNHGIGNIFTAIKEAQSRDLATIIERYHKGDFKFASSNFYTCFLAALYAEKYQDMVFPTLAKTPLQERQQVILASRISTHRALQLSGIDRETFLKYNLDLKRAMETNAFLPKGFELHLPPKSQMSELFVSADASPTKALTN